MSVDDKYTYPGSGGVLVNAAGIRDQRQLDEAMNDVASITMAEFRAQRVPDRPDYAYLRGIHERMFGDLVPGIAGKVRDVDVQATGTGIPYCRPEYIDANLSTLFGKLEREGYLAGLDADTFAVRLADRWGELSTIHAFREGNTRAQFVFFSELTDNAGYRLDAGRFHSGAPLRDSFVAARFYNQATGRSDRLAGVLNQAVTRRDDLPARRPGESSIERLQQRVDDQRTRRRRQFRPGGSTAHDGHRGPRQGPSR